MKTEQREYRGDSGYRRGAERRQGSAYASGSRYADKRRSSPGRRRGRKKNGAGATIFLCLLVFLLLAAVCIGGFLFWQRTQNGTASLPQVSLDSLDSPYAVLMDRDTASVLGEKRRNERIYPASMTKILTVLTAIEQIRDLDATITMSYDYYEELYAQDASRAGFEPGEEAVIRDLLYGALLPSGAECCMELAIQAAGSEEAFVERMNEKVRELGLTQTHFTNCTGLHHEDQYSTVTEIALILREALDNRTFRQVFTTHSYTVQPTSVHPDGFTFWSTLFKAVETETVTGGEILGGKTGYTSEAGHCLASMAQVGSREYILVTAGWAQDPDAGQYHITDAFAGYNLLGSALGLGTE